MGCGPFVTGAKTDGGRTFLVYASYYVLGTMEAWRPLLFADRTSRAIGKA